MLPVERQDFENLITGDITETQLEKKVRERLAAAKARISSREIAPQDLYETYKRLNKSGLSPEAPVDLSDIWTILSTSTYLRDLGCTVLSDANLEFIELCNLSGVSDKSVLTTSRETHEYGLPDIEKSVYFASYGEPVFDSLIAHFQKYKLPACVRRVEVEFQHGGVVVGYLAAVRDPNGDAQTQLLTSLKESEGIVLDEERIISAGEMQEAEARLHEIALKDFRSLEMAVQLEAANSRAGISQLLLEYLVIQSIIDMNRKIGTGKHLFWEEVKNIEEQLQEKETLDVILPEDNTAHLNGLLFPLTVYRTGNKAKLEAPIQLVQTALDAVCRLADSLHFRKADLETEQVLGRTKREVKRLLQQLS